MLKSFFLLKYSDPVLGGGVGVLNRAVLSINRTNAVWEIQQSLIVLSYLFPLLR